MPKVDLSSVPVRTGSNYPGELANQMQGRSSQRVGAASGITQFGANITILAPGAKSSLRHWHEEQDEFLVVIEGDLVLVDDLGETPLGLGDCAAFPAGDANGHHVVNKSDCDGRFLVIGTHTPTETAWYSDMDMKVSIKNETTTFSRKDGTPF